MQNNNRLSCLGQNGDGNPENSYQIIDTYDANNNQTSEYDQIYTGGTWVNRNKTIFTYDINNNCTNKVSQSGDGSSWKNVTQSNYIYNINNKCTMQTDQVWDGSSWVNGNQFTFIYDVNNNLASSTTQSWDGSTWVNSWKGTSNYDVNHNQIASWSYSWDGSQWVDVYQINYNYNADSRLTSSIMQSWNGIAWTQISQGTYTYYDAYNFKSAVTKVAWSGNVYGDSSYHYSHEVITPPDWTRVLQTNSYNSASSINYVKHDNAGNTFTQARIKGSCNFFGTNINSTEGTTLNAKFDKSGNVLWVNLINDLYLSVFGPKFSIDKDNNLLAAGSFNTILAVGNKNFTNVNAFDDSYIVKYAPDGQILWAVQLATDGQAGIDAITFDKDGNVIISGEFMNLLKVSDKIINAGAVNGAFIIKFDAAGNCLWARGYPIGTVYVAMVSTDESNNVYLTGEMYDNNNTHQLVFGTVIATQTTNDGGTVLVKLNADGIPQWAYTYGGVAGQSYSTGWPVDIKTDAAGNSYLWGWCANNAAFGGTILTNPIGTSYSYYLTKINSNGSVAWAHAIYEKAYSFNYGDLLDLDKNGNIYVGGHFKDSILVQGITYTPAGTNDFFTAKFNNDGAFQWIKTMPSNTAGTGITAISVYDEDILSICGSAGKDPTLGNFIIDRSGVSTSIIATLGMLESAPNTLYINASDGSSSTFTITSNANWTATCDQTWLTVSSNSGNGNETLTFTATANQTGVARTATVTITFLDSKFASITLTIVQDAITTGIAESTKQESLIYPNPSNGKFTIRSNNAISEVEIYNITGERVFTDFNFSNRGSKSVDLSNFPKGIYLMKIYIGTKITTKKIVVQ
jgi:hypothetical protein